jgi:hypothetical protein
VTTEHEFKITYRGAEVPEWVMGSDDGDHQGYNNDHVRKAFMVGVDAALGAQAEKASPGKTTPALREWIDRDGDSVWELEPGVVSYSLDRHDTLSLDEVERRYGPLIAVRSVPVTEHPEGK